MTNDRRDRPTMGARYGGAPREESPRLQASVTVSSADTVQAESGGAVLDDIEGERVIRLDVHRDMRPKEARAFARTILAMVEDIEESTK